MLGLLVIIIISWMLLHFIEKKNIEVLGVIPTKKRISQFVIGFFVIISFNLIAILIESIVLNASWKQNDIIHYNLLFDAFVYHIRSALTEDLVFRGAILYILIQRIGAKKGIFISALVFGVYHIFSYGMTNSSIIAMLYVTLMTGFTGYVWAYTFYKTKSIMLGLGFHLGYNYVMSMFYENQPYGQLIFQEVSKIHLEDWNWLLYNIPKGLFPSILTLIFVKQYLKYQARKQQQ
ncbi:MAG: CPBP family intramembrane metalloprotease [Flavobacteriaceae bacterium]|nr:CPBP family intramembrane metalloprotease [Flavobacteriaceae bacterium]